MLWVGRVHSHAGFELVAEVHVSVRSEPGVATSKRVRIFRDLDKRANSKVAGPRLHDGQPDHGNIWQTSSAEEGKAGLFRCSWLRDRLGQALGEFIEFVIHRFAFG